MPQSVGHLSQWDLLPSETILDICRRLPTLDLLNICAAYPILQPLILNTPHLWRTIHLPYPDPLLYNYPGWRECLPDFCEPSPTQVYTRDSSSKGKSKAAMFRDRRYRFLNESEFYSPPSIVGGEQDGEQENSAWIILDVLQCVPLRYVRHVSFECPPCHLCTYPCPRFCVCECHQNEQYRHSSHRYCGLYRHSPDHQSDTHSSEQDFDLRASMPLSQPLQDLLGSGIIDFSRHIDLQTLDRALRAEERADDPQSFDYFTGVSSASVQHLQDPSDHLAPSSSEPFSYSSRSDNQYTLRQLSLEDAVIHLSHLDDEQDSSVSNGRNTPWPAVETGHTTDRIVKEAHLLEQSREQAETRAAYQRAVLLLKVLSLGDLETLETLQAPWWPATRIYTIRQQLERWSFLIEQHQADNASLNEQERNGNKECRENTSFSTEAASPWSMPSTGNSSPHIARRTRWTNSISHQITGHEPSEAASVSGRITNCSFTPIKESHTGEQIFPLASLTRFTLRSGGEVSSHERHSLDTAAQILSGRSSAGSSVAGTPPQTNDSAGTVPAQASGTTSGVAAPSTATFRYCHYCGSQYLHTGINNNFSAPSDTIRRGCSCP